MYQITEAVAETYRLYDGLNDFLTQGGFRPLEELLLGNSLSGLISEFLVKNVARACPTLVANEKVGGYPDLLPSGHYSTTFVLKGDEGIEVKASIQRGGSSSSATSSALTATSSPPTSRCRDFGSAIAQARSGRGRLPFPSPSVYRSARARQAVGWLA